MNRLRPPGPTPYGATLLATWLALHCAALLAVAVSGGDVGLSNALCVWTADHPAAQALLRPLTAWGDPGPVTLLAVGTALSALVRRDFVAAAVLLAVPYAATVSCGLLKGWTGRERPGFACASIAADGLSFPSGHAVGVSTGYVLAAIALNEVLGARRPTALLVPAVALADLVSFSRVLLGVHHVVDVLAGQLLAVAWLGLAALPLTRRRRTGAVPGRPVGTADPDPPVP
ncbi:phosphatase PAP2 family protein [Streptomyces sp. NPDC091377]|uniref:phosphatase PAP2 family protein n=1 Tax=Streptomyces sp. NPDC091377 TaxID=3365995 RepID=UPI00382EC411